jgi:hypothetical protein
MKYEWRKKDKTIYIANNTPKVVDIREYAYFTLSGQGNPNSEAFSEAVGVLYALSYAVKMLPKKGEAPRGYYAYTVFPLEGVWDIGDKTKAGQPLDKDNLLYTIMIRQPDFVTDDLAMQIIGDLSKKKPSALLETVRFERMADGLCVQMLHVGSYNSEPKTFEVMNKYCDDNGYRRIQLSHKEIYLSDPKKTPDDQLKTTLRFSVEKI